jgi:GNAT superfamily N-acetyltransferase
MEILEAAEEHIPGITRLWMEYMYFNSLIEPYNTNDDNVLERVEAHLRDAINSGDYLVLIARDNGLPVGYSISSVSRRPPSSKNKTLGHIDVMAVTAGYHGQGIGRQMTERIKVWFESRNVDRIELSEVTKNATAESFWRNQGFNNSGQVLHTIP